MPVLHRGAGFLFSILSMRISLFMLSYHPASSSCSSRRFMFMYFLHPHWVPATWRSRAHTNINAEFPPGNSPTLWFCAESHGSDTQSHCWYESSSRAPRGSRSRSAFLQYQPLPFLLPPEASWISTQQRLQLILGLLS